MGIPRIIEGTGEQIAEYTKGHPNGRFQLIVLSEEGEGTTKWGGPDPQAWNQVMDFIHSQKGKLPVLPLEATSTEALYD